MQLYLIRHGQSYINLEEWEGGHIDTNLTELGHQQAAALANWLPNHLPTFDTLYTSSMKRAVETTEYLSKAYDVTAKEDDRIREIGNNRRDHSPWPSDNIPTNDDMIGFWSSERPFSQIAKRDDSESMMHFKTRVGSFIESMLENHADQTVVVVCHGGVLDMVIDYAFNVGPYRRCELWTANTGITHFEYIAHPGRELWRLHFQNRVEHLRGVDR